MRNDSFGSLREGAAKVLELFTSSGLTLGAAESCTGGLLAARLTDIPGSSNCFLGSVVAYSDEVKVRVLGVPEDLIRSQGAVSRQVAQAMAEAVRDLMASDVGIGITGIAGPGGGRPSKPVGLTYIAVSGPGGTRVEEFLWRGTRRQNREQSVKAALALLVAAAGGTPTGP